MVSSFVGRQESLKKSGVRQGIAQKQIDEVIPRYESAPSETIYSGDNNSFVILGRDRPSNFYSGYGGKGAHQAGRIDLIAGLASSYRHKDGSYHPPKRVYV